jgi:TonB family protein
MFLVSSATGGLVRFDIHSHKLPTAAGSRKDLLRAAPYAAASLAAAIAAERTASGITVSRPRFPDVPEPGTKGFEGLRPPMPFRRIKPEYTATANLYGIKATVEIAVDIDAAGAIANTEIVRWGGYGLDESVEKTVRAMNWRPATLGERSLPMRVLLRYNFVKVDKDDEN